MLAIIKNGFSVFCFVSDTAGYLGLFKLGFLNTVFPETKTRLLISYTGAAALLQRLCHPHSASIVVKCITLI